MVVTVPEVPQPAVEFALVAAGSNNGVDFIGRMRTHEHSVAVVGEEVEFDHLIDGERARPIELGHHRVNATGVVADHPTEGVAVVGGRVGPEGEPVLGSRRPEVVEVAPRLHHGSASLRIDRHDPVQVLGEVEDHRHVGALAGQAGPAAAAGDRYAVTVARDHRGDHVVDGLRDDNADRTCR